MIINFAIPSQHMGLKFPVTTMLHSPNAIDSKSMLRGSACCGKAHIGRLVTNDVECVNDIVKHPPRVRKKRRGQGALRLNCEQDSIFPRPPVP